MTPLRIVVSNLQSRRSSGHEGADLVKLTIPQRRVVNRWQAGQDFELAFAIEELTQVIL